MKCDATNPSTHPMAIGGLVAVPGREARSIAEGRAVIKGVAPGRGAYRVQFIRDPVVRTRVVPRGREAAGAPAGAGRASIARAQIPPALVEDFFPDAYLS